MRLDNEFVVPRPIEQAWGVLTNVELIAPCMPGAQLTETVDDNYHGTVKVKVGPVVALYAGVARFRELDPAAHHAVLEANGKQRNGNGRASAVVTADLADEGEDTRVKVSTELTIAGPLAQFGRGAIAEVSTKLLGQFVDRLKEMVLAEGAAAPAETPASVGEAPAPSTVDTPAEAVAVPATPSTVEQKAAEVEPVDLLGAAGLPILKRLVPLLVVVAIVVVVLVIWLS